MATNPLDQILSDIHIDEIASNYLTDWQKLRPYLGLNRPQEQQIRRSFPGDYKEQKREFLDVWKQEKGNEATYRAFIKAAQDARNKLLADNVEAMLPKPKGKLEPLIDSLRALGHTHMVAPHVA